MEFKIRDDFELRAFCIKDNAIRNYSTTEISNSVSYFYDKINNIPYEENKTIGIVLGRLGFLQLAFMLALVRSGRHYTIFYYNEDFHPNMSEFCNHIFFVGPWDDVLKYPTQWKPFKDFKDQHQDSKLYSFVFERYIENEALHFNSEYNLSFKFSAEQKVYIALDHTVDPKLAYNTGRIEESCIEAAIKHYYDPEDNVVLVRPFRHIGVATLSIYPAVFCAKKVTLCAWLDDWEKEYQHATHIHVPFDIIRDKWPLPKRLRMVTSGGYAFNTECIKYIHNNSYVENIVDCYGTAFCPPPLAIRFLRITNKEEVPFTWVNEYINPVFMLSFTSNDYRAFHSTEPTLPLIENGIVKTRDVVYNNESNKFWFFGPTEKRVRINHSNMGEFQFVNYVKKITGIKDFDLEFKVINSVQVPIITINEKHKDKFDEFVKKYSAEIIVNYE